jgi:simple sugar transport system substrate-binding protein
MMHVGQPEYAAGKRPAWKRKARREVVPVREPLRDQPGCRSNAAAAFADAIGADYKTSTIDAGADPTGIQTKVSAYLRNHPDTKGDPRRSDRLPPRRP